MTNPTPKYHYHVEDCREVVPLLDEVIDHCKRDMNPLGYFAALYRLTTVRIVQGIEAGEFQDNERMARMDAIFANRYFDAMARIFNGEPTTQAWTAAAEAAKDPKVSVLQHLFLGMNAHINLDLSVAAAHTCPGESIHAFKDDFDKINDILGSLVDTVQEDLGDIWHPLRIVLHMTDAFADLITYFGLEIERRHAWNKAVMLAQQSGEAYDQSFQEIDRDAHRVGERIHHPGWVLRHLVHNAFHEERGSVAYRIQELEASSHELQLK